MLYVLGVQLDAETDIMYARMAVNLPQNPSRWFGRLSELTRVLILPSSHSWTTIMARMHRLSVCATMALRSLKLLPRAKGTTAATSTLVRSTSEALDTEFKRRYPPDQFGKEMDDNARVWQVLRDEASAHDHSMLDEWNKTLDILLIFAGLFSAVATAFVVESYRLLQPDNNAFVAAALYALVLSTNNTTALRLLPTPPPPATTSAPSASSRWINGLWFTSLFISLTASLLCILVKQWLAEYAARTTASATNRQWARRRTYYFRGITTWHMSGFISVLPLLLHASLFLFFAGMVTFLWTLDRGIGAWIIALGTSILTFYACCTALPLWWPNSPTSTPLIHQMRKAWIGLRILALRTCIVILPRLSRVGSLLHDFVRRHGRKTDPEAAPLPSTPSYAQVVSNFSGTIDRLVALDDKAFVKERLELYGDDMDSAALRWLILSVSDSDAVAVGLQAIGALRPFAPLAERMRTADIFNTATFELSVTGTTSTWTPIEIARIARSLLCLHADGLSQTQTRLHVPLYMQNYLRLSDYPDTKLLFIALGGYQAGWLVKDHADYWRAAASPSLTSTAILLLHSSDTDTQHALWMLLCIQLDELSSADWACVFRVLRRGPSTTCSLHSRDECRQLCLAELLAELILRRNELQLDSDDINLAALLIGRALSVQRRVYYLPLGKLHRLLDFVGSDLFLEHDLSETAILQLEIALRDARDWLPRASGALSTLTRALCNLLHVALQTQPTIRRTIAATVAKLFTHMLDGEYNPETHPAFDRVAADAPPLDMLVAFILQQSESLGAKASIWQMLHRLDRGKDAFLRFTDALATALCSLSRRGEAPAAAVVDAFFASAGFLDLLRYAHEARAYSIAYGMDDVNAKTRVLERLVQHCVELRPSWWSALVEDSMAVGDEDLKTFVQEISGTISQRGSCTSCPQ